MSLFSDIGAYILAVLLYALAVTATLGMFEKTRLAKSKVYKRISGDILNNELFEKYKKKRNRLSVIGMTLFILLCLFACLSAIYAAFRGGELLSSAWFWGMLIGIAICFGSNKESKFLKALTEELKEEGIIQGKAVGDNGTKTTR